MAQAPIPERATNRGSVSTFKFIVGVTLAVYPALRLVGDVDWLKAGFATVCITLGILLAGDSVIDYVLKRQRERWRR